MIADKQRLDFRCHLRSIRSSFNKVVTQPVTLTNVGFHALLSFLRHGCSGNLDRTM